MSDLPNWVWDLVADLLDQEAIHPRLMFKSGGMADYAQWDWCPANALARVPDDVKAHAKVVADYRRSQA